MDAEQTPAANPDQFSYEETLWWRATRSKPVTVGGTVLPRALDRAWAAFVERWNTETGAEFVRMLERRETTHERLSLGALARRVCELSWEADRIEWKRISAETPLSDTELEVISQYEQALQASSRAQGAKRGAPPRRVENLPLTRGLPHTPLRSPERRPQAPHGAPSYQAWTQPVHEIFKMWRNFAIAVMDAANLWWGSASIVVLKDRLHDISRVISSIHERSRVVTLEWWTKAAGRKLRPRSFWIVLPSPCTGWSTRMLSCIAEYGSRRGRRVASRRGRIQGTLARDTSVTRDNSWVISIQAAHVERRVKSNS
ncbi:hypothetical protein PC123_g18607 [Phytophthora cactorum]|nr:hypothetical protein PC123_g18607 [Phytophthora cactorum]